MATTRRRLLRAFGSLLALAIGAVLAVPATLFLVDPARRRKSEGDSDDILWPVADLNRLPEDQPIRVAVTAPRLRDAWIVFANVPLGAVWLIRRGSEVRALSTVCPHAGCAVDWDTERQLFRCPCHGSNFTTDGECVDGPAPRALDVLPTTIDGSSVRVAYRRFRPGVRGQEPL